MNFQLLISPYKIKDNNSKVNITWIGGFTNDLSSDRLALFKHDKAFKITPHRSISSLVTLFVGG
jgi:hypothetical protein